MVHWAVFPWLSRGVLRALAVLTVCLAPLLAEVEAQGPERSGQVVLRASELVRKDPEFQETTARGLLSSVFV